MTETPAVPPDSFAAMRDLLSLIGNEKRAMRTLNQLEDRLSRVTAAESKLAADRAAFEEASSKTRAELEDKAAKLRAKEISLMGRESLAEQILAREKSEKFDRLRPMADGMTIVRAPT